MSEFLDRWNERARVLVSLLRAHGAEHHEFRVDLAKGRFWWQPAGGPPSVVAETRVVGSYALSNRSVLAGWANRSLPVGAAVLELPGVAERGGPFDEADAWYWALQLAEGAGAHFAYRVPTAQSWIFLGLWDVRAARPGEEPFVPDASWDHVLAVLAELQRQPDPEARVLARNYGRTFVEDRVRRGTPWEGPLRAVGEQLVALADRPAAEFSAALSALRAQVEALSA